MIMNSKFLTLGMKDFVKGLIVAVLSAVLSVAYTTIEAGSLEFDWKAIGLTALAAAAAYLIKNLFQNSSGVVLKSEGVQPPNPTDPKPR